MCVVERKKRGMKRGKLRIGLWMRENERGGRICGG